MKYGLLNYIENQKYFNVGDNIQSLAAKQFLPKVDKYIDRESLASYDGDQVKLIMNGWFIHNTTNWVPSDKIIPLFVSFHMNNTAAPSMLSDKGIAYLKKYEPIGCRDEFTVKILNEKGIEAYFTGCLTLTLDSYKVDDSERGEDVYIVDPLYNYPSKQRLFYNSKVTIKNLLNGKALQLRKKQKHLEKIISKDILETAKYIDQEPLNNITDQEKFKMAEDLLKSYARAKLVITSRIHCALPCLAMGTPVIYINGFDSFVDSCRFDGILELFNRIDINSQTGAYNANFPLEGKIDANTMVENLGLHHKLAEPLKERCKKFIAE
ncbi:hypothetical protein GCM10007962_24130 [Yeosuana aromativorans]|uniref:Polysaccharide pyruvyl transferase domain-containing protein n=1 Tax=Yeosuana aromativorans TaxID=288019 RepID=A0A8J3BPD1_9FLAO|nr:polysaccharide pyruvyl transferase family protein [Yeosuana aromativorans]GGK29058.1 hypothetical protein GCM10007962_24130 [Yeosuana aromativorans]